MATRTFIPHPGRRAAITEPGELISEPVPRCTSTTGTPGTKISARANPVHALRFRAPKSSNQAPG